MVGDGEEVVDGGTGTGKGTGDREGGGGVGVGLVMVVGCGKVEVADVNPVTGVAVCGINVGRIVLGIGGDGLNSSSSSSSSSPLVIAYTVKPVGHSS